MAENEYFLLSRRLARNGLTAFEQAKERGFEGLVAKDLSSPYVEGRTTKWLKVKVHQEDEFVILGYTAPAGSRQHFGALLLGAYKMKELYYVGKVGTGFSRASLAELANKFRPLIRKITVVVNPPREKQITYLEPRLVAQIAFEEWTADEKLRQPVFLGLRDDKKMTVRGETDRFRVPRPAAPRRRSGESRPRLSKLDLDWDVVSLSALHECVQGIVNGKLLRESFFVRKAQRRKTLRNGT